MGAIQGSIWCTYGTVAVGVYASVIVVLIGVFLNMARFPLETSHQRRGRFLWPLEMGEEHSVPTGHRSCYVLSFVSHQPHDVSLSPKREGWDQD